MSTVGHIHPGIIELSVPPMLGCLWIQTSVRIESRFRLIAESLNANS